MHASHTPGPWRLLPLEPDLRQLYVAGPNGIPICRMGGRVSCVNTEPNGHLIEAAPDLLEALVALEDAVTMKLNPEPALRIARDAIAKARQS